MKQITINVECEDDMAIACREVAEQIEKGYMFGIIGASGDDWEIQDF